MKTEFLLLAAHDGKPLLPAALVCKEYFPSMTLPVFLRKAQAGELGLPLTTMGPGQKGAKMVHISDLAAYIDAQRAAGKKVA